MNSELRSAIDLARSARGTDDSDNDWLVQYPDESAVASDSGHPSLLAVVSEPLVNDIIAQDCSSVSGDLYVKIEAVNLLNGGDHGCDA